MRTGDVVRWTLRGQYTYAAVKTPQGWYTTARSGLQVMTDQQLADTLARDDVDHVEVATEWQALRS